MTLPTKDTRPSIDSNSGADEQQAVHYNRPGLPALSYRLSTHATFLERMLARLPSQQITDGPHAEERPLAAMTARTSDDIAVALLDAWAVVGDVLTFYQERIANEGYLRTATERRSILELARAIGYELRPGVAASTYLAFSVEGKPNVPDANVDFTMKNIPGLPDTVIIPKGTKVKSVPTQGRPPQGVQPVRESKALPQTFETVEEIEARAEWNALKPHRSSREVSPKIDQDTTELCFRGVSTQLQPGNILLFVGDEREADPNSECWAFRVVQAVAPHPEAGYTLVSLGTGSPDELPTRPTVFAFRLRVALFGHNAPDWNDMADEVKLEHGQMEGGIFRSTDKGNSWTKVNTGLTPSDVRCLAIDSQGRTFAGTNDGVFRSTDDGDSWTQANEGLTNVVVRCLAVDSKDLVFAGTNDGVFRSNDHGDAWTKVGAWSTEVTTDNGNNWMEITPSLTNIIIRALAINVQDHIFARTDDSVFRSDDNGKTWALTDAAVGHDAVVERILQFFNKVDRPSEIVERIRDDPDFGKRTGYGIRPTLAARIISVRNSLPGQEFTSIDQIEEVRGVGPDTLHDIFYSFQEPEDMLFLEGVPFSPNWSQIETDGDILCVAVSPSGHIFAGTRFAGFDTTDWPNFFPQPTQIDLDAVYPRIVAGSWVVLLDQSGDEPHAGAYKATKVSTVLRSDFGLNLKITRIIPDTSLRLKELSLRETIVFAQSEPLALFAEQVPDDQPFQGSEVELDRFVPGLKPGRTLIFTGKRIRAHIVDPVRRLFSVALEFQTTLVTGTISRGLRTEFENNKILLSQDITVEKEGDDGWLIRDKVNYHTFSIGRKESGLSVCRKLELISADGLQSVKVRPGDLLQVMSSYPLDAEGPQTWHLKDRHGFVGFVTAESGQITFHPAAKDDKEVSEAAFIEAVSNDDERTRILLRDPLQNSYDPAIVTINANVVQATHGETVYREVLGSGNGAEANQLFTLKKTPLTYVSAPTASGAKSTIEVFVNDVKWEEVPSLYGLDANSQSYAVQIDDDGATAVIFGDGESGARLPSGQENVVATYRQGIGPDGEVDVGSLMLLQTRPLGIRGVTNPLPATGAAPPETLDEARVTAPRTVLTLDRVVSLQDFEDFARAFSGIGKSQAVDLSRGETSLAHITVADANGDKVTRNSPLYNSLTQAIRDRCDPVQQFQVDSYQPLFFRLEAKLLVDPRYREADVKDKVESALRDAFVFGKRSFGQDVTTAEIISVIQSVSGVVAVDLDKLYLDTDPEGPNQKVPKASLTSATAYRRGDRIQPAQLLLLHPDGIALTEVDTL